MEESVRTEGLRVSAGNGLQRYRPSRVIRQGYSLKNLNRRAGFLNCGAAAVPALNQRNEIFHFFPVKIGVLELIDCHSRRCNYLHFRKGALREGVGYKYRALFKIECEAIFRESEGLRCIDLDYVVAAKDQRGDIVPGRRET